MFIGFRLLVVVVAYALSCIIPNIHILLTFAGAVLGTIVNIVIPVLFYNKAYQNTARNRKLQTGKKGEVPEDDEEPLMKMADAQNEENNFNRDPRLCMKIASWIALGFGTVIAIIGIIYIIMELKDGAK